MMSFLRYLLFPFALLYGLVLCFRHWLYNIGLKSSSSDFGVPVICVGNLNLGGTGKTPFTEFLIDRLSADYNIGVVSRGYGRKTKGYVAATLESTADEIGDEPLQIFRKYNHTIQLAVSEDRTKGINRILEEFPFLDIIILDDAFQHRKVKADVNILLSPYKPTFFDDFLIPFGKLRDVKLAARRAHMLVFTKSPNNAEPAHIEKALQKLPGNLKTNFYYSSINYKGLVKPFAGMKLDECPSQLLLVTGIARPEYIVDYLKTQWPALANGENLKTLFLADHHEYKAIDIDRIAKIFDTFAGTEKAILTTEKDWVKLAPIVAKSPLKQSWLVLPISFEMQKEEEFLSELKNKLASELAPGNDEYLR